MKWFPGSINEAVAASKTRKAVFVVFVAGDDEVSIETAKVIDTLEISSRLQRDDFVAIRLESGSESYRFFAQIYQLVPVPSLFFIGDNGKPLEVIAGTVTASSLQEKIDSILAKLGQTGNASSSDLIRAEQSAVSAQSSASSSNIVSPPENQSSSVNSEPAATASAAESNANVNVPFLSIEEKVERARKLIERQAQQKLENEKEEERRREIERREAGKHVQNTRRRQQEIEIAQAHEERMREKAAEREARERVIKQIAQDKLERKMREQALLNETTQNQQAQTRPQLPPPAAFVGDGVARIQFRLPSGSSHMGKFEASSSLRELRAYVMSNIELPFRPFALSMSFPRRDLTVNDDEKTLQELELVPTAVILILPMKNANPTTAVTSAEEGGFLSRFMWALFAPILTVYNYVAGYFTGTPARGGGNSPSNDSRVAGGASGSSTSSGTRNNVDPSLGAISRALGGASTTIRARGNIHRLHSGGDDNDENNTWNGNSTQQM